MQWLIDLVSGVRVGSAPGDETLPRALGIALYLKDADREDRDAPCPSTATMVMTLGAALERARVAAGNPVGLGAISSSARAVCRRFPLGEVIDVGQGARAARGRS